MLLLLAFAPSGGAYLIASGNTLDDAYDFVNPI